MLRAILFGADFVTDQAADQAAEDSQGNRGRYGGAASSDADGGAFDSPGNRARYGACHGSPELVLTLHKLFPPFL